MVVRWTDGKVDRPDGAQGTGTLSWSPQVPPQRPPPQWSMSSTFEPGFSSTPQQQYGAHSVLPGSVGARRSESTTSRGLFGPRIALAPLNLPKFSGDRRSYWRWKGNWGTLQALAEPTGSLECRLFPLLDSIVDAVKCKLRLSHCRTVDEVFRVLEDCYGDMSQIADDIVLELQDLPAVRNNQPREALQLIQAVERALLDLIDLGCEDAIKKQLLIRSLESKLRFNKLWQFLRDQKTVMVQLEQLQITRRPNSARAGEPSPREKPKERPGDRRQERRSFTRATASEARGESSRDPCSMCGQEGHTGRLYRCKTFRKANPSERRAQVKKTKACPKCLDLHGSDSPCNQNFLCRNDECKGGDAPPDYHFFLCLKSPAKKDTARGETKGEKRREPCGPTEEQEALFANLSDPGAAGGCSQGPHK